MWHNSEDHKTPHLLECGKKLNCGAGLRHIIHTGIYKILQENKCNKHIKYASPKTTY